MEQVIFDIEINALFRGENRELARSLVSLTDDFKNYWPMTLRAFYYQAVSALLVKNEQKQYKRIGDILKKLRRAELVPWYAMEDKTRTTSSKRGESDVTGYIESDLATFLNANYYQRCYIQNQPVYVEISVEKDALSTLIEDAAYMHCTRVSVTRGQPSATMINDMAERFENAYMHGLKPILLHFGDLDPTGVQIPKSMKDGFKEHHDIEVDVRHVGLTPGQCKKYNLPISFDAAKAGDPNHKRWVAEYGTQAPLR